MIKPQSTIAAWASTPDISARSVLVTIFGDTVLPVTPSLLLAQIFSLTEVFGFSERLVRTSMFRLHSEEWFISKRVGRQSRYTATAQAIGESEHASERIYGAAEQDWQETPWTLVLLDPALVVADRAATIEYLRWSGFFQLGADMLGSPTVTPGGVEELRVSLLPDAIRAVVVGRFEELETLLIDGFFTQGIDAESIELDYKTIIERYRPFADQSEAIANGSVTGEEAFALRTMLVHDLRRIKLRYPELPASLHPADWAGRQANELACQLYPALSICAAPVLSEKLGITYPQRFADRFVS